MARNIEKWKDVLQSRDSGNEAKTKAVRGLIQSGIHPSIVKSWALRGAKNGGVDRDTRIRQLKWVIGRQSGTTGDHKRKAVQQLLDFGISSEVITDWAKQ